MDVELLMEEMYENQTFQVFGQKIRHGLEKQEENEKIRAEEKELALQLKRIQEDLKKQQDEFAKEAAESSDDISKYKKLVNEA